ncbi:hypothetical protein TNCV_2339271 [Trichonephila clavipes]|nr:hypothetical protein TNCV_2339271 [Trichonephila clavipes]
MGLLRFAGYNCRRDTSSLTVFKIPTYKPIETRTKNLILTRETLGMPCGTPDSRGQEKNVRTWLKLAAKSIGRDYRNLSMMDSLLDCNSLFISNILYMFLLEDGSS